MMYDAFEALPNEKKEMILNAAFTCFGKNGYEKTSVSDIARDAGISKASVFHYFGSKKELYLYLYNMALTVIIGGITRIMKDTSTDFFIRIMQAQKIKLQVVAQYIGMYDFLYTAVLEDAVEFRDMMDKIDDRYKSSGFETLLQGIDWQRFKPEVSVEMVINAVTWISEGYIKQAMHQNKPLEVMTSEVFEYMELLKKSMYKEEYL